MGLCYFQLDYSDADSEDLPASCLEKFHSHVAKNDPNQIIKKNNKKLKQTNQTKTTQPKQTSKTKPNHQTNSKAAYPS